VTSLYGADLGDHGRSARGPDLSGAQLHVPLVIAGPGIEPRQIAETASLVDLAPTLIELAGFTPPRRDGRSLVELVTGGRLADPAGGLAYAVVLDERRGHAEQSAIVRGPWKLVDTGQGHELYDLRVDPGERFNLFGQRPAIVNELRQLLGLKVRAARESPF
jgi:arylsulfatase A-like enzyme